MSEAATHYRLHGEVGGATRSYGIPAGESSIGSVAGNQIVLGVRGVSRRHALLTLSAQELLVEDLGSRNGTRVNGVRVQRSRLQPGDELQLGPVALRVEQISRDDEVLAIRMRKADAPASLLSPRDDRGLQPGRGRRVASRSWSGSCSVSRCGPSPTSAGPSTTSSARSERAAPPSSS